MYRLVLCPLHHKVLCKCLLKIPLALCERQPISKVEDERRKSFRFTLVKVEREGQSGTANDSVTVNA